jgi:hypothetical protein
MANYNGPLEAVDCDMHVVRYDMVLERSDCADKDCLIRSPTTLYRRRYGQEELEPRKRCFYTIITNYNGSLEAVDCDMHIVRYDLVLENYWRPTQIASSGNSRRCNEADMVKKSSSRAKDASILSWPTIMGRYSCG